MWLIKDHLDHPINMYQSVHYFEARGDEERRKKFALWRLFQSSMGYKM